MPQSAQRFLVLPILCILAVPFPAHAETKLLTAEGTYTMGDGETPAVAEMRALHNAKRMAVEQAGTYLESYSKAKNFQLTTDDLQAIAGALVEVEVLEKKRTVVGQGFNFYVKVKATVTTDKVTDLVARLKQKGTEPNTDLARQYKELQTNYGRVVKDIDALKQQLAEAKSKPERDRATAEIAQKERRYHATELQEKGDEANYKHRDPNKAIEYYTQAISIDPTYNLPYFARGMTFADMGQTERAVADFTEGIRLAPNTTETYLYYGQRGKAYAKLGQYEKAVADFTEGLRLLPPTMASMRPSDLLRRGEAFRELGKFQEAIRDYSEAISLDPTSSYLYGGRGMVYSQAGQASQAVEDLTKAINLENSANSNDGSIYGVRGMAYSQLGKTDEAIADFTQAIQLSPERHAYFAARGFLYAHKGHWEAALRDYTEALRLQPKSAQALAERAYVYQKLERYQEAISDLTVLIRLKLEGKKGADHYQMRGWLYAKLGQNDLALADLNESLKLDPQNAKSEVAPLDWTVFARS